MQWARNGTKSSPPAYRNTEDPVLEKAIALGCSAIAGTKDLVELNHNSLACAV